MQLVEGALSWPLLPAEQPDTATDDDVWAAAADAAVDWLWRNTAMMFGTRPVTYRPQALIRDGECWQAALPYLQSVYSTVLAGGWSDRAAAMAVLELPGPVQAPVAEVRIAGAVLDAGAYRLDGRYLVRTDGESWPTTQNLLADEGAADTWAVDYTRGRPVPVAGQVAAAQLAAAWYPAFAGEPGKCRLPYNATTVSRGGVTVNRDVLKALKTSGVQLADVWVASVNPSGAATPGGVWSPDLPRGGRPYHGSSVPA